MDASSRQPQPLTVSELTEQIKSVLEDSFRQIWVEGELSHLNPHRSGHVYLSLKDEGARIDGVVWRSTVARLQYRPDPGEKILVRGKLNIYAPQGGYKLIVESIDPLTGALQAAFNALKDNLQRKAYSIPQEETIMLPRAVGVDSSTEPSSRCESAFIGDALMFP